MDALNEPQGRHLVATFKHVDEVLTGALQSMRRSDQPFAPCIPDMQPSQIAALECQLHQLRLTMALLLQQAGLRAPQPEVDASWVFRTAIVSARIDIEELGPHVLKGYGKVTESTAASVNSIINELRDRLAAMEACLPPVDAVGHQTTRLRASPAIESDEGEIE